MKNVIRMELNRGLKSCSFKVVMFVELALALASAWGTFCLYKIDLGKAYPTPAIVAWLPLDFQLPYGMIFVVCMPLFATVAYSIYYFKDRKNGYEKNILLKISRRNYHMVKYFVCFFIGFIVLVIPLMVSFFIISLYLPMVRPETMAGHLDIIKNGFLVKQYYDNQWIYVVIYTMIIGMFGGVFSVFGLCLANVVNNIFEVAVLPFVVVIVSGAFFQNINMPEVSIYEMIQPLQSNIIEGKMVIVVMILCIISTFYKFCIVDSRGDVI